VFAASVVAAPEARAELTLRWEAPANCPQRNDVLERIRALAGSSLDNTDELGVEGRIDRAEGRYALTLLVRDEREVRKRVITSDSCADLAGAAAVTLALLLGIDVSDVSTVATSTGTEVQNDSATDARENGDQRGSSGETKSPSDAPAKAPPPTDDPAADDPDPSTPTSPSRHGSAVFLRVPVGSFDLGPLPDPALGLGIGVGVRIDAFRVALSGRISERQHVDAPEALPESGAELDRFTAELSGCYGLRARAFEVAPCLVAALEFVTAQGKGEGFSPQSARAAWPALGIGAVGHWYPWESLAIFAGVTGYVELARPRLVIEGLGQIAELGPVAAGAVIGAEWIF
jgi:hypothetical protein